MQGPAFSTEQVLLTTLVVKLAAMAALATMLVRYRRFRHILIFERRGWPDRLIFVFFFGIPLAAGVVARLLLNYRAFDLSLEGSYLAGLIAGPYAGATIGMMVGVPPLFNGEVIALPFAVGCGFAGGGLRELCPKEAIWHFSPFVFTRIHQRLWDMMRRFQVDWQVVLLVAAVGLELLRQGLGVRWSEHSRLFYLGPPGGGPNWMWTLLLVLLATILCVATPIKIWNTARIEHRVQEQEKLLLAAKVEALKSQINPHFLFNTLASISSLIRSQPETARTVIVRLSALLRRLMRSHQHFVTLREELESIDEYLDIEVIRFGPKLRVRKEINPDTLDIVVPSMLLQPIVENSIKHGFARKVGPGVITIRSRRENGRAIIEVEDDGMGFMLERLDQPMSSGIGLANVRERLAVIYGDQYQFQLTSEPGHGTSARIEIPELTAVQQITA